MKKIINVKSKKSLIENLIENAIKVGDKDYEKKLRKRVVDLSRARDLAKGALKRAEENGQTDVAEKLRTRIEEIDTLLATYNTDTLEDDPISSGASDGSEAEENSGSDQDSDENAANKNDSDEQDDSSNKNGKASEDENADEQSDNQNGKEDGDDSDSNNDQKGKGDGEDSESENDQNDSQKDKGGNEEEDPSGSQSQGQDSDGNDDNAEDKPGSEGNAKNSQNDNKKADKQDGAGENDQSDSDDSAEDSGIHNDIGSREGSDSDDQQDGQSKNGKGSKNSQDNDAQNKDSSGSNGSSSNDSENEDEPSDQNSNGGEGSESNSQGQSNNQQDSDGGDGDGSDDESANDSSDNGQDSKNQQDANSQKSNSSSSDKKDSKNTASSKPSLDQDSSSDDGESEFQNPFADDDDISSNGGLPTGGKPPREATKDETIDLLGTLTGEGREGAKDALKDLIAKRKAAAGGTTESFKPTSGQSLTEAIKGVRDMTDDEFGDYINDTYDLIDKADPVNYIDDIEDRKKKVGNWSQDPTVAQDLFGEDDLEIQKDYQKKKARAGAKAKYSRISGLKDFEMDFYAAIHNQVETIKQEYQSYEEINAEYESEDAIMKADIEKELPAEAKPIIDVYFDVSGSWEEKDIKIGEAAIASVKVFEDQGDIVLNVFFFSDDVDNVSMEHCRDTYGYGTHAWPKILQNIKATDAKNVLIMTDDDFERLSSWDDPSSPKMNGSLTVDGCVWYLWKNGNASPCCLPKLKGRQGTRQYGFRS